MLLCTLGFLGEMMYYVLDYGDSGTGMHKNVAVKSDKEKIGSSMGTGC